MRSPSNERSGFPVANRFGLQAEIETDYRKIVQSVKLSTSDEQGDMGAVGLSLNLRRLRRISCRMAGLCRPPLPCSAYEPQRTTGTGEQHGGNELRSEEHTSELQSLMRSSYAVFCLKNKKIKKTNIN